MVGLLCYLSKNDDPLELVHFHKTVFSNLVQAGLSVHPSVRHICHIWMSIRQGECLSDMCQHHIDRWQDKTGVTLSTVVATWLPRWMAGCKLLKGRDTHMLGRTRTGRKKAYMDPRGAHTLTDITFKHNYILGLDPNYKLM
jgi:hypothetical protein